MFEAETILGQNVLDSEMRPKLSKSGLETQEQSRVLQHYHLPPSQTEQELNLLVTCTLTEKLHCFGRCNFIIFLCNTKKLLL